jgi:hypothetical protein
MGYFACFGFVDLNQRFVKGLITGMKELYREDITS